MCSKNFYKVILVAFNIVFFILGAITLGVGLFVKFDKKHVTETFSRFGSDVTDTVDAPSLLESSAYVLMVAGGFMLIVGFLGCCGAWKEWRLFLVMYAVIVGLILVIELAAAIIVLVYKEDVDRELLKFLRDSIKDGYKDGVNYDNNKLKLSDDALTMSWDLVQFSLECCGADNYMDWRNASIWDRIYSYTTGGSTYNITAEVPLSCCKVKDHNKFPDKLDELQFEDLSGCLMTPNGNNTNMVGCYEGVQDVIVKYAWICAGIGLGIGLLEILGVVLACCLCRAIGKDV